MPTLLNGRIGGRFGARGLRPPGDLVELLPGEFLFIVAWLLVFGLLLGHVASLACGLRSGSAEALQVAAGQAAI